jgi:hypothetical protein
VQRDPETICDECRQELWPAVPGAVTVAVTVGEAATAGVYVNTITYAGNGSLVASDTTTAWSSCDIGIGVNSITYDNEVTLF